MKLLAIRAVMRMFSWISPRVAEYIAPLLAALVWYSVPRLRRVTRRNLGTEYQTIAASGGARYSAALGETQLSRRMAARMASKFKSGCS